MSLYDPYDICACAQLRKTARSVTQRYDAALRPTGLKLTQFAILRVLAGIPEIPMTALAEQMVLDRTSLTRNLKPLERDGMVTILPGKDSRQRLVKLTAKGRSALKQAEPLWLAVQHQIIDQLGHKQINNLNDGLADLSRAARN